MAARKKAESGRTLPAVDMRGNVAVGTKRQKNRRLMVVQEPFADGHGPVIVGQAYWFDAQEAKGMEKSGVVVSKAKDIVDHLQLFGVLGVFIDDATDPDIATAARRAGLSIHEPTDK